MLRWIVCLVLLTTVGAGCVTYDGKYGVITDEPLQYYRNIDGSYPDVSSARDD